ncbi:MAG: ATP-binding protein, partial [Planctomycetes bacterium]|nr:ATP-binding protein [Planctomycetota bacterium]
MPQLFYSEDFELHYDHRFPTLNDPGLPVLAHIQTPRTEDDVVMRQLAPELSADWIDGKADYPPNLRTCHRLIEHTPGDTQSRKLDRIQSDILDFAKNQLDQIEHKALESEGAGRLSPIDREEFLRDTAQLQEALNDPINSSYVSAKAKSIMMLMAQRETESVNNRKSEIEIELADFRAATLTPAAGEIIEQIQTYLDDPHPRFSYIEELLGQLRTPNSLIDTDIDFETSQPLLSPQSIRQDLTDIEQAYQSQSPIVQVVESKSRKSSIRVVLRHGRLYEALVDGKLNRLPDGIPQESLVGSDGRPTRDQLKEVATSWFDLAAKTRTDKSGRAELERLLRWLGFDPKQVNPEQTKTRLGDEFAVTLNRPITDPTICPLPSAGSKADGRYRVLVLNPNTLAAKGDFKQVPTRVFEEVQRDKRNQTIVVCPKGISYRNRQDLADECRTSSHGLLLLDEYLLQRLLQETDQRSRLRLFFRFTLAFSSSSPFSIKASVLAPEMFFGRTEAIRRITSMQHQSGLLYGGRQLGKTVLLKKVTADYNQPADGIVVTYTDILNTYAIRNSEGADHIWAAIGNELYTAGVLDRHASNKDTIRKRITQWLEEDRDRRIIMLFDETDKFLESDRDMLDSSGRFSWPNVRALLSLSNATEQRFKFVLAGLHNVQRATRDVNNPVAHLDEPIAIGPMHKADTRHAQQLVENPFAAMGYEFHDDNDIRIILARMIYYPGLIQICCDDLLKH